MYGMLSSMSRIPRPLPRRTRRTLERLIATIIHSDSSLLLQAAGVLFSFVALLVIGMVAKAKALHKALESKKSARSRSQRDISEFGLRYVSHFWRRSSSYLEPSAKR